MEPSYLSWNLTWIRSLLLAIGSRYEHLFAGVCYVGLNRLLSLRGFCSIEDDGLHTKKKISTPPESWLIVTFRLVSWQLFLSHIVTEYRLVLLCELWPPWKHICNYPDWIIIVPRSSNVTDSASDEEGTCLEKSALTFETRGKKTHRANDEIIQVFAG